MEGQAASRPAGTASEVFSAFLKLGLTSFGGPIAHLGYFRDELVVRRKWIDEKGYGDIVALCQFLPGPASSQVGFALGLMRGGPLGALAAWSAFTLPSQKANWQTPGCQLPNFLDQTASVPGRQVPVEPAGRGRLGVGVTSFGPFARGTPRPAIRPE